MAVLPAHLVALPVLERVAGGRRGVVLGTGTTAAWVDLDGFVVAVTTREVPLLPNAVALSAGSGSLTGVAAGTTARFAPGRVDLGALRVTWDPTAPPTWDPTVPVPHRSAPEAVAGRGAALLRALGAHPAPEAAGGAADDGGHPSPRSATLPLRGPEHPRVALPVVLIQELARIGVASAVDPDGAAGLALLFRGVGERDPEPAAAGARELLGRGPGLTPEGDDVLAGVAGTVAVLGAAAGLDGPASDALLAALAPDPGRTTALSATLLALAARRRLVEPAGCLLDLRPTGEAAWPAALRRLERLGHGSGRAYAAGIAATASLLAASRPLP